MTVVGLTQRVSTVQDYQERRDALDQEWTRLCESIGVVPIPLPTQTTDIPGYMSEIKADAIILTGGNDLASMDSPSDPAPDRDEFEGRLLTEAINQGLPVVAVCRGFQLVNCEFGGGLVSVDGHVAESHTVKFSSESTTLQLPAIAETNSYHDYAVTEETIAEEFRILGLTDDGVVECASHESLPIFCVMWHPERDSTGMLVKNGLLEQALRGEI